MKAKRKYIIKDQILKTVFDTKNKSCLVSEISKKLDIDFQIIHTLTEDIIHKKYLSDEKETSVNDIKFRGDKFVAITQKGRFFLSNGSPFIKEYNSMIKHKIWQTLQITASVATTLIIIAVSIWAINVADKTSGLENDIIEKNEIIKILNLKIDTLKKDGSNKEETSQDEKKKE